MYLKQSNNIIGYITFTSDYIGRMFSMTTASGYLFQYINYFKSDSIVNIP
jgi:hypothetical protein